MYFKPNCISRLLAIVELMRPIVALPSVALGALNWGALRKLKASYRNCSRWPSLIRNSLNKAKSHVFWAGASNNAAPAFP